MTITSTLNLADGSTAVNAFMTVNIHTELIESTGKAPTGLKFWRSEADKDAGNQEIFPKVSNVIVSACELSFTGAEVVKAGSNCTVADTFSYYKSAVKTKLNSLYGWNINL
jgi:hypothetical protein